MPGTAGTPPSPGPSRRGTGLMPAFLRICQTMAGATVMPSPASSPWIRRYPQDPFSRASRSVTDRTLRCVAGAPGAASSRPARLPAADDVPLPAQDRAGSDDQPHRRRALRRHRPRKERQPRPVRPRQTQASARPLAPGHSELMAQHENLGVLPPPLPPRQAQQRYATGDNQEDQPQPHKPKIIPRPGRRRGASRQRSAEHPAWWHRFSAPTGSARRTVNGSRKVTSCRQVKVDHLRVHGSSAVAAGTRPRSLSLRR